MAQGRAAVFEAGKGGFVLTEAAGLLGRLSIPDAFHHFLSPTPTLLHLGTISSYHRVTFRLQVKGTDLSRREERRQASSETRRRSIRTLPSRIICLRHTEHTLQGTWLLSTFVYSLLPQDPPGESHLREHCPGLSLSKLYP